MILLDALEIRLNHVRHSNEVPIKERKTIIIVFDIETVTHMRRNLINKAEPAVIGAAAYTIKYCRSEFRSQFLIILLIECEQLLFAGFMLQQQFDILIGKGKTQVNNIPQPLPIDFQYFIAWLQTEFLRQPSRQHPDD